MDTTKTLVRSARSFFAGTAISRVSGLLRDIAMAISFGSSSEVAAFFVAYRLANLFRRLLGEGNLNAAFIPHYSEMGCNRAVFYRDVVVSMAVILTVSVIGIETFLWGFSAFVGPDWKRIITLTMWMVPGLFFVCLYGLNSALLQCHEKYFIPAAAPVFFNCIWIFSALLSPSVEVLACTITLAFFAQWFVTAFEGMKLLSLKQWLSVRIFSADFKRLIKPMMLGVIGIGAVQFNSALDPIFARFADLKGPAYLWYAIRIQQLPLALFGIALTGALLPSLSRAKDPEKKKELLHHALKHGVTLMLVCTFGILALGDTGMNLLFGHGDFLRLDVLRSANCLNAYALGLVPSVLVLILAANCYSEKNYHLPSIASLVAVISNILFNALFVFLLGWGAVSVAFATSISSVVNCIVLSRASFNVAILAHFFRVSVSLLTVCIFVVAIRLFWTGDLQRDFQGQVFQFSLLSFFYLVGVFALLWRKDLKPLLQEIH